MFLREARAYLRSAEILRNSEPQKDESPIKWENRNPIYFLLLHATELAIKAVGRARDHDVRKSHDIVILMKEYSIYSDWKHARAVYFSLRSLQEQRLHERYEILEVVKTPEEYDALEDDEKAAHVALEMELASMRRKPVGMANSFRLLGALGQSNLVKKEFGQKVTDWWWHAARYPRFGTTSYPDFDACVTICKHIIDLASKELPA